MQENFAILDTSHSEDTIPVRFVWLHQPPMNRTYNIVPEKKTNLTGTIWLATCMTMQMWCTRNAWQRKASGEHFEYTTILALSCLLLTILYLLSLFSLQARYCMYGWFEVGATRRAAQVLYPLSEKYWELHNSLTSFLHCSVVWCVLA